METGQIRQGDILLDPVDITPPVDAVPSQEVVLALGEVTGHAHRLRGAMVLEWEQDGQRYVRVQGGDPGSIVHEDHDPIPAYVVEPETTYRVVPQKQWDLSGQWQRVVD